MEAFLSGVAVTEFGRLPGFDAWEWQQQASLSALDDAQIELSDIDALITGYATTSPHLMPANVLAERLGLSPTVAFGMNVGGATGLAMVAQAAALVTAGHNHVLVVAGEDRASGQSSQTSAQTLAQVGHPEYEVPLGADIPAYYALLASWYLWKHNVGIDSLAQLPVQMRQHATTKGGAHFRKPIDLETVMESRMIADPLQLLHCCPVSDGAAAFVVSASPAEDRSLLIRGIGQAHRQQYLCSLNDPSDTGAAEAGAQALTRAGLRLEDVDVFGIYDSFSVTLALLLEELGIVPAGMAGDFAKSGAFSADGSYPLNTHGGLLSYGHSGVSGGMSHLVEVAAQLRGERQLNQVKNCRTGYVHADGGVMSAHVGLVIERVGA